MEKEKVKIHGNIKTVILNTLVNKLTKQDGVRIARLTHDGSSEDDTHISEYAISLTPFDMLDKELFRVKDDVIIDIVTTHFGSALKSVKTKWLKNTIRVEFNIVWGDIYCQISDADVYISKLIETLENEKCVDNISHISVIDMNASLGMSSIKNIKHIISADIDIDIKYMLKNTTNPSYVDILHDIRRRILKCLIGSDVYDDVFKVRHLGLVDNGRYIQISIEVMV